MLECKNVSEHDFKRLIAFFHPNVYNFYSFLCKIIYNFDYKKPYLI